MNYIKFEVIKRKAIEEFHNRAGYVQYGRFGIEGTPFLALLAQIEQFNATGKLRPATAILDEWQEYGQNIIEEFDVRMVGKLAELFPSCVPAHWKGRKLGAEMLDNANCDWVVYPAGELEVS